MMKKINIPVRISVLTICMLFIASPFAYGESESENNPLKSLASSSGNSKHYTEEQRAAHDEARKAKKASKAYKRVKDKAWEELSKREKKYAVKNGIADAATFDAWKAQQKEVEDAKALARAEAKKAKQAAKLAKENAKAYKRVKNKEWNELTKRELAYANKHGIDTKEKYDAWKAEQAAAATPLQKVDSVLPGDGSGKGLVSSPDSRTPSSTSK